MAPEALQYLQRRLDDVRNVRLMRHGDRNDVVRSTLAQTGGCLEAMRGVGLISDEEFMEWNARFWEATTGQPLPTPPGAQEAAGSATSVTMATAVPLGDASPQPALGFQGIGFRRLIPGPDEEKVFGPGTVRIVALVQFEDGVNVEWLFSLPPDTDTFAAEREAVAGDIAALPPEEQARRLRDHDNGLRWHTTPKDFALSDDVGTVYELQGGGAHGGPVTMFGHQGFSPRVPPAATRVYVDSDGIRFTVRVA